MMIRQLGQIIIHPSLALKHFLLAQTTWISYSIPIISLEPSLPEVEKLVDQMNDKITIFALAINKHKESFFSPD